MLPVSQNAPKVNMFEASDLKCLAKADTTESSAPVKSTSDSVAINWSCPVRTKARVTDGARVLKFPLAASS